MIRPSINVNGFNLAGKINNPNELQNPYILTIKYPNAKDKQISIIFEQIQLMLSAEPSILNVVYKFGKKLNNIINVSLEENGREAVEEEE